jgi:hypothetical protein
MNRLAYLSALLIGMAATTAADAQSPPPAATLSASVGVVVFPAKGQSAQLQSQDEGECYAWSKNQTGVDPMAPAAVPTPPVQQTASQPQGTVVRGAARGAVAGTAIGAVAGDTGKGAAIGATAGTLKGVSDKSKQSAQAQQQAAQQQQQAAQQQEAARQQQLDLFRKGFSACLEGKGYTVK